MQKGRRGRRSTVRPRATRRSVRAPKAYEHSVPELYLHGLAAMIGLGILVLPVIAFLLYSSLSIYLVVAAGFIALMLGVLIYDISLSHNKDPYTFLKHTVGREYSFIFGFLFLISLLITTIAAGIASIDILASMGVNLVLSTIIVDIIFIIMWITLYYKKERRALNFIGILKILFLILLVAVAVAAVSATGVKTSTVNSIPSYLSAGSISTIVLLLVLFVWMYGGFESIATVYKGEDKSKVARALIYSIASLILVFGLIQVLVYLLGPFIPVIGTIPNIASLLTSNISSILFTSTGVGYYIITGLAFIVILTIAFAVMNAGNKVLHDMSLDGIVPSYVAKSENYKLILTAALPMVLITVLAVSSLTSPLLYIGVIALSAISLIAAFFFLSLGYASHYSRSKDYMRVIYGIIMAAILLFFIIFVPPAVLIGLFVILAVALIGYLLIR
ncbi:amino acid permease [Candidatus Parvarchaeota archaeon]|nr:amino acid permease [Candidatus Acidifodinimicrobium mancum]